MSPPPSSPDGAPARMLSAVGVATAFFALSRGVTPEQLAEATGVSVDTLLGAGPWLPQEVVPRIWLLMRARCPGEPLGFEMAGLVPLPRLTGEVGRMASLCPDLRSVLRLLVRNRALMSDTLEIELVEEAEEARLIWHHPMDLLDEGCGAEVFAAAAARQILAEYADTPGVLRRLDFRHAPLAPRARYAAHLSLPMRFGAPHNALVFAPEALDLSNPQAAPGLAVYAQQHLDHFGERAGVALESEWLQQVQAAVVENAARGQFSGPALARRLGMSQRALQRRLRSEGLNARELLAEERMARARVLLREEGLSVDEIAFMLDYASGGSFSRAFERFTGQTPSQARAGG